MFGWLVAAFTVLPATTGYCQPLEFGLAGGKGFEFVAVGKHHASHKPYSNVYRLIIHQGFCILKDFCTLFREDMESPSEYYIETLAVSFKMIKLRNC